MKALCFPILEYMLCCISGTDWNGLSIIEYCLLFTTLVDNIHSFKQVNSQTLKISWKSNLDLKHGLQHMYFNFVLNVILQSFVR